MRSAGVGSRAKVTGRTSARPTVELSPGTAPAKTPRRLPPSSAARFTGWSAVASPSRNAVMSRQGHPEGDHEQEVDETGEGEGNGDQDPRRPLSREPHESENQERKRGEMPDER